MQHCLHAPFSRCGFRDDVTNISSFSEIGQGASASQALGRGHSPVEQSDISTATKFSLNVLVLHNMLQPASSVIEFALPVRGTMAIVSLESL
jgi:hypothetical protein